MTASVEYDSTYIIIVNWNVAHVDGMTHQLALNVFTYFV